jgi:fascin 1/2
VGRKRFAHLSENLDEIHVDANIPWGEDTLFTLEFRVDESGKYALHTCNNKYLSREGKLVDSCNPNCLYSAEYHSGQLALRDRQGGYLSPIGSKAVLKSRSLTVTKDELFSLEDSLPQASFVAALNGRYVSVKQGKPDCPLKGNLWKNTVTNVPEGMQENFIPVSFNLFFPPQTKKPLSALFFKTGSHLSLS